MLLFGSGGELIIDMQDSELLPDYHMRKSEAAFAELVKRHVDLVYGAARRQAGEDQMAQEITQKVFCLLARKSAALQGRASISGWLYRATCFLAAREVRQESRRRRRECEAAIMNEVLSTESPAWEQLSPLLDELMNELPEYDRVATILRFFQRKSMSEIAAVLGVSEAAAKMRVSRAVERLRRAFAKRGIVCQASVLTLIISERAAPAASQAVMSCVLARHAASASAAGAPTLSFLDSWRLMATPLTQTAVAFAVGSLLCAGAIGSAHIWRHGMASDQDQITETAPSKSPVLPWEHADEFGRRATAAARTKQELADLTARLKAALHKPASQNQGYPSEDVRNALLAFGSKSTTAFSVLKEAAKESNNEVRRQAASGMGTISKRVPEVVPYLWDLIRSPESYAMNFLPTGALAFTSLRNSDLTAKDLSALTELLVNAPDLQTIGRYAPAEIARILNDDPAAAAERFVPALEVLLDHTNASVRFRAACALANYESQTNPTVLAEIARVLNAPPAQPVRSDDPDFARKKALLGVPGLEKLMALETLQKLGSGAKPLLPDLRQFAAATDQNLLRESALRLIGTLDPGSRLRSSDIDRILRLDEDRKQWFEKLRSQSLTLEELIGALNDDRRLPNAVVLLGQLGPAAQPAVPSLAAALRGRGEDIQNEIVEAIREIDPSFKIDLVRTSVIRAAQDAALNVTMREERSDAQTDALLKALQPNCNSQWTYKEMTEFADDLGAQDAGVRRAFVDQAVKLDGKLEQLFSAEP